MITNSKGQTIIEALVALTIAVVIISGIAKTVVTSVANTQYSRDQNLATQYAQQGIEFVRKIRNQSWTDYAGKFTPTPTVDPLANTKIACLNDQLVLSAPVSLKCPSNVNNKYIRAIKVDRNSCSCGSKKTMAIDIRKVTVIVAWSDSKCYSASALPLASLLPHSVVYAQTATPTPTPVPDCDPDSLTDPIDSTYCHKTQLVTCLSDYANIPTPTP